MRKWHWTWANLAALWLVAVALTVSVCYEARVPGRAGGIAPDEIHSLDLLGGLFLVPMLIINLRAVTGERRLEPHRKAKVLMLLFGAALTVYWLTFLYTLLMMKVLSHS